MYSTMAISCRVMFLAGYDAVTSSTGNSPPPRGPQAAITSAAAGSAVIKVGLLMIVISFGV